MQTYRHGKLEDEEMIADLNSLVYSLFNEVLVISRRHKHAVTITMYFQSRKIKLNENNLDTGGLLKSVTIGLFKPHLKHAQERL